MEKRISTCCTRHARGGEAEGGRPRGPNPRSTPARQHLLANDAGNVSVSSLPGMPALVIEAIALSASERYLSAIPTRASNPTFGSRPRSIVAFRVSSGGMRARSAMSLQLGRPLVIFVSASLPSSCILAAVALAAVGEPVAVVELARGEGAAALALALPALPLALVLVAARVPR